ncbi:MAG: Hsp20/alpha crystallin family protein [Xenococcaceae cyanobacterium]
MSIIHRDPFREIERWDPFREIESVQREINRLFERLMPRGDGGLTGIDFMPSVEMEDAPEEVRLKLEVPGLEAKDIDIEVTETSVSISGERQSETKAEEKGIVRSEFHYGKFERVIKLPAHIQNNKVEAEYKNGILKLTLPKVEEEKHKTVKVEVAEVS